MALKVDYTDDVFEGNRKYTLTDNGDGTYTILDVTTYTTEGDTFASTDINETNTDVNNLQITAMTAATDIADADYFPYYDASASAKRKSLWSNIKSVLKTYFDALYFRTANYGFITTKSASYTIALAEANSVHVISAAATITVPTYASVAFPTGTQITFVSYTTDDVDFSAASGVTINSKNSQYTLNGQYASATIVKTDTNTWVLIGNLKV